MAKIVLYGIEAEVPEHPLLKVDEHGDPWIVLTDTMLFCRDDARRIELLSSMAICCWEDLTGGHVESSHHADEQATQWRRIRDSAVGQQHR